MFTFPSLSKLLVLIVILAVVWFGFRVIGQLDRARKEEARLHRGGERRGRAGRTKSTQIQDMAKCPTCGAYVPTPGATPCGRGDCPY